MNLLNGQAFHRFLACRVYV